mmetsp:Transcript_8681/g.35755  ORF Transcript_8681/g.35755 Transcript_8681/m.35755 type:complete len:691 (-) Transcript_8681:329-2401(-)
MCSSCTERPPLKHSPRLDGPQQIAWCMHCETTVRTNACRHALCKTASDAGITQFTAGTTLSCSSRGWMMWTRQVAMRRSLGSVALRHSATSDLCAFGREDSCSTVFGLRPKHFLLNPMTSPCRSWKPAPASVDDNAAVILCVDVSKHMNVARASEHGVEQAFNSDAEKRVMAMELPDTSHVHHNKHTRTSHCDSGVLTPDVCGPQVSMHCAHRCCISHRVKLCVFFTWRQWVQQLSDRSLGNHSTMQGVLIQQYRLTSDGMRALLSSCDSRRVHRLSSYGGLPHQFWQDCHCSDETDAFILRCRFVSTANLRGYLQAWRLLVPFESGHMSVASSLKLRNELQSALRLWRTWAWSQCPLGRKAQLLLSTFIFVHPHGIRTRQAQLPECSTTTAETDRRRQQRLSTSDKHKRHLQVITHLTVNHDRLFEEVDHVSGAVCQSLEKASFCTLEQKQSMRRLNTKLAQINRLTQSASKLTSCVNAELVSLGRVIDRTLPLALCNSTTVQDSTENHGLELVRSDKNSQWYVSCTMNRPILYIALGSCTCWPVQEFHRPTYDEGQQNICQVPMYLPQWQSEVWKTKPNIVVFLPPNQRSVTSLRSQGYSRKSCALKAVLSLRVNHVCCPSHGTLVTGVPSHSPCLMNRRPRMWQADRTTWCLASGDIIGEEQIVVDVVVDVLNTAVSVLQTLHLVAN